MPIDSRHVPYAAETAMCVDLALDAMEEDICAELEEADQATSAALNRLLNKLRERRTVLDEFTKAA
jgi:cobalamin biosynthesis Co2+ chelatase CbiK